MRVVVLGIGNILLSDEGVGVRVIERLDQTYRLPSEVEIIDGGTCGMEMLEQLEDLDALIVVDCVRFGQPPATPVLLKGDDVPVFFKTKLSPHQVSLSDVLASLELLDAMPKEIVVLGVEPISLELGMEMTPTIAEQVPVLVEMAVAELRARGYQLAALSAKVA